MGLVAFGMTATASDALAWRADPGRPFIVAANRDAVTAEANVVRKARLQPVVADSSAFALIRAACQGRLPEGDEAHAIADIGADQLTVVVHQAGQPRFIRTIANLGATPPRQPSPSGCAGSRPPTRRSSTPPAAPATRPPSSTSSSSAPSGPTTCPTAPTCATSPAASP